MKPIQVKFSVLLLGFGLTALAQQTSNTSFGNAIGRGGTASYSVGQVVYNANMGSNGSASQGVQQPFEISTVIGLADYQVNLQIQAYPNPTENCLTLSINKTELASLDFQLYDLNGKLLACKAVTSPNEIIHLSGYANATYFLKVSRNNMAVKTFKIIKN